MMGRPQDVSMGGGVAVALLLFPMICNKAIQEIATSLTALAMTPRKSVILNVVKNLVISANLFVLCSRQILRLRCAPLRMTRGGGNLFSEWC